MVSGGSQFIKLRKNIHLNQAANNHTIRNSVTLFPIPPLGTNKLMNRLKTLLKSLTVIFKFSPYKPFKK